MKYHAEIQRRRTFAIISHPDAGKTTPHGEIPPVRWRHPGSRGRQKATRSKIPRPATLWRSNGSAVFLVATSVMSFEYRNILINLLDTRSIKTLRKILYRTLTAVDSVILVVDSVNGEDQTRKLMEVCRMRDTR